MKISPEIIEKYHQGNCTPAEKEFVENWLLNDDVNELRVSDENKDSLKNEMWADISNFISEENEDILAEDKPVRKISFKDLRKIAAAVILFTICAIAAYNFYSTDTDFESIMSLANSSEDLKEIDEHSFFITMAPHSNTTVDLKKGLIDSYGSILFSPKKDLELNVKGYSGKVKFKNGETYIVLSNYLETNKVIVLNENDVLNLPPVIQRQLITQFNI